MFSSDGLPRPLVTLVTDFGLDDWYVAAMKGVLMRHCAAARIVDITHMVPPGDVLHASIALERAIAAFSKGAVHLAVVDPGVGTARRAIIAMIDGQIVIAPDNGLITWAMQRRRGGQVYQIDWRPQKISATFHGRDLFAPVAGMLADGVAIEELAHAIDDPIMLDLSLSTASQGYVIHLDRFGNAMTNLPREVLERLGARQVKVGDKTLAIKETYAQVETGEALALIGSSDLLELAVNGGSAAKTLGVKVKDQVFLV